MLEQVKDAPPWVLVSFASLGIYLAIVIRVLLSRRDYKALERMALDEDEQNEDEQNEDEQNEDEQNEDEQNEDEQNGDETQDGTDERR